MSTGADRIDPALAELAAAHGVATEYRDHLQRRITIRPESVVAVLDALGVDPSSPAPTEPPTESSTERPTEPVVVLRTSEQRTLAVRGPARLVLETGERRELGGTGDGQARIPAGLPLGWHRLDTSGGELPVVVAPDRLPRPPRRHWGWATQLYAAASRSSWGIGDLADLRTLGEWSAQRGAGLVLVNPLHAAAPGLPVEPSPYYPSSRRWTNPLYLRIEDTAAYAAAPAGVRAAVDAIRPAAPRDRFDRLDRNAAWAAKQAALASLWPYADHPDLARLDPDLRDFATWCALAEGLGRDWRAWPVELQRPGSPAVANARRDLADRVSFHAWQQLLVDRQLGEVQRALTTAGMTIGVVHDLAVGIDPAGADGWALQDALAHRARIGAPPDSFNQQGQDWGMPPWHPRRLAELGYAPVRDMLRSLLRHAGGVRIDHVLGLFRAWWIPAGGSPRDGTYVAYDADALLGIVTLEAARAGAMVIGEDLGTLPAGVRRTLRDRGILGTSVLWFERTRPADGKPGELVRPERWRDEAAASVTTHDLPTALGWLRGEHVRIRAELGLLDDADAEWASWQRDRDELVALLIELGLIGAGADEAEIVVAMHAFLGATSCRVVLAAPGDAVGDLRQPNLPGTTDEYPNWRLPLTDENGQVMLLDDLLADPRVARLAAVLDAAVR